MRLKFAFISPGSSGCCGTLSGIPARAALWRRENISWPCAPVDDMPAAYQTNDTATSPRHSVLKQTRIPSVGCQRGHQNASHSTWARRVCPPANSCISGLLRLHIACDLMAGCGQQLWGKEGVGGWVRGSLCVVFSSAESVLAGVRVGG